MRTIINMCVSSFYRRKHAETEDTEEKELEM